MPPQTNSLKTVTIVHNLSILITRDRHERRYHWNDVTGSSYRRLMWAVHRSGWQEYHGPAPTHHNAQVDVYWQGSACAFEVEPHLVRLDVDADIDARELRRWQRFLGVRR